MAALFPVGFDKCPLSCSLYGNKSVFLVILTPPHLTYSLHFFLDAASYLRMLSGRKSVYWLCKIESVGCQRGQVQVKKLRSFRMTFRDGVQFLFLKIKVTSLDNHLYTWRWANHFELWERPLRALVSKYIGVRQLQLAGRVRNCPFTVAMLVESLIFIHACTEAIAFSRGENLLIPSC